MDFYKIRFFSGLIAALSALMVAGVSVLGGQARADEAFKFDFHGFVSTTAYYQSTPDFLLNGQGPLLALATKQSPTLGFDARQTRLNFAATGPEVLGGATPKGFVEMDFFGLNSAGSYGEVSALPRLRLAYAELNWGNTIVRAGQDWELLNAQIPLSLSHIAFPFYGAGFIAWREPGVGVTHNMNIGESKLELGGQILKSDWQNPYDFGLTTNNDKNVDAGQLSGLPGVEARAKLTLNNSFVYVVGHWNRVGASHAGEMVNVATPTNPDTITGTAPTRDFDVIAVKLGGKTKFSGVTLAGEVYSGKNLGPMLGNLLQFPIQNDIHEIGGWFQAGYDLTDKISGFALYSTSVPNGSDAATANAVAAGTKEPRLSNSLEGLLIQYKDGAFAAGPEIFFVRTELASGVVNNRQYALSANYAF